MIVSIRYPDTERGEVPIAFVVRFPNCFLTEEDVKRFIANQVRIHILFCDNFLEKMMLIGL